MKQILCCFVAVLLYCMTINAQRIALIDSLKNNLDKATTDQERFQWLEQLGNWYRSIDRQVAYNYFRRAEQLANLSQNNKLRYFALFDLCAFYIEGGNVSIDSALYFAQKAMALAKNENNQEFLSHANLSLAYVYSSSGDNDKALRYVNEANSIAAGLHIDSLNYICYMAYYYVHLAKKEKLPAFRNLGQAWNIAESLKNEELLFEVYKALASFYKDLGNREKERECYFQMIGLTYKNKNPYARVMIYDGLGVAYTDDGDYDIATHYFEKGLRLADTLQLPFAKMEIYNHIMRQYFLMNEYQKSLAFYLNNKDLQDNYINTGNEYFNDMLYARLLAYTGKPDSAGIYFWKAEPKVELYANIVNRGRFYNWYADYYNKKGDINKSIEYYKKENALGEETGNFEALKEATANLDTLYQRSGDYKAALIYSTLFHRYKDSLQALANERELMSAEINSEAQRRQWELQQKEEEKRRRYNIQYIGIVIGITALFIVLVMMGIFRVSSRTIKAIGFFSFLLLFEFIFLLFKKKITGITHGEPWKDLLFMILLAAILLPLHHWLEHRVIHYLTSHNRLTASGKGLMDKVFKRKNSTAK